MTRRRLPAAILAGVVLLGAGGLLGACGSDDGGATDAAEGATALQGLTRPEPLLVGSLSLPAADTGEPRVLQAAPGELLLVYFGYLSCPDVCPTTMADIGSAMEDLGPEAAARLEVAFVTVDPGRDDAARLTSYLDHFFERHQALRTEDPGELARAEDAFLATSALTPNDLGGYDVTHSATTYVVDDTGAVVVEWAFGTAPELMAHDLGVLLAEADDRS